MKRLSIALCLCCVATAASLHFQESAFVAAADGAPPGWSIWSARPETAPRVFSIRSTIVLSPVHSGFQATAMVPNTVGGSGAWREWKPDLGIDSWRTIVPKLCRVNPGRW